MAQRRSKTRDNINLPNTSDGKTTGASQREGPPARMGEQGLAAVRTSTRKSAHKRAPATPPRFVRRPFYEHRHPLCPQRSAAPLFSHILLTHVFGPQLVDRDVFMNTLTKKGCNQLAAIAVFSALSGGASKFTNINTLQAKLSSWKGASDPTVPFGKDLQGRQGRELGHAGGSSPC